jgi:hypothetical protein
MGIFGEIFDGWFDPRVIDLIPRHPRQLEEDIQHLPISSISNEQIQSSQ